MKKETLWLGFDIQTTQNPVLQPHSIDFWKAVQFKKHKPEAPFHYKADALTGLSLSLLNKDLQKNFAATLGQTFDLNFAKSSWMGLEPHFEMYNRSQMRVQTFRKNFEKKISDSATKFQSRLRDALGAALTPGGINLDDATEILGSIDLLETELDGPLMFNWTLKLDPQTVETLHLLHSLLFNLRTLVAMDHNAHVQDPTHEALRVDSITDYLPRADYIANDAILYWQFTKMQKQMTAPAFQEMENSFTRFSHHAVSLITQLPKSFLQDLSVLQMEDSFYLAQMDWLLGTEAGLLFRLREELFGLSEGYDRVFWPDCESKGHKTPHTLSINCNVSAADWSQRSAS